MNYEKNIQGSVMLTKEQRAAFGVKGAVDFERILMGELPLFHVKDPISSLTHFIGFIAAIIGMPFMLAAAAFSMNSAAAMISVSVFMLSMVALYGASTAYHTFNLSKHSNSILKKLDHGMIFVLIAGTYTPYCTVVVGGSTGMRLLLSVWLVAVFGIAFKIFWVTCPKWVSSVIYIGMGWLCVTAFADFFNGLPLASFVWLLVGGIIYTVGGVIYALKLPVLWNIKGFGGHELFHLFVMGGSLCHYISVFYFFLSI